MPDQANYDATTVWDSFIFEVAHGVDPVQALNDMLSRSEIELEAGAGRTMLTADRTYYVNPTSGLDTNDGLTTGTAWETIQKAVDFVSGNLDLVSFDVTIQLADDTYVEPVDLKPYLGSGDVTIKGNSVTPANVFWDNRTNTVGANVNGVNAGLWRLDGLKLSTDAVAIRSEGATNIKFQNIDFDISSAFHLGAYYNGIIEATGDYEISGSALNAHMYAVFGGTIITINRTVTIDGTPDFGVAFAWSNEGGGNFRAFGNTYTSSGGIGKRYELNNTAVCFVNGAGATYFPGASSGTVANGAVYN